MWQRAGWIRLAGAISSGLLVAGLFPPFHAVGLAWVALVPLLPCLWSLDGQRRGWHGFGLAWLAGSVSSSIQFSWMAVVSPLAAVLLPLYLGLFWGLFGAFAATLGNPWHKRAPNGKAPAHHGTHAPHGTHGVVPAPVVSPTPSAARLSLRTAFCHGAVWAGTEWLRSWLFTGFGWNGLGVAFHDTLVLAQAADLLGVTGLSLALVFFQSVLVLVGRRMWLSRSDGKRRPRWDLSVAALLMGLLPCYGLARIHAEGLRKTVRLKALLVQLNIPQDAARMLWDDLTIHRAYEDETLSALAKLANATESNTPATAEKSAPPAPRWPDWVIWPESALQGRIMRSADGGWGTWQENLDTIAQVRTAGPFSLIFGVNEMEAEPTGEQLIATPGGRMYNSLAIMSADDELQTFRKHHLVIFGETIPYVDSLPFLKDIYAQQAGVEYGGSFTSGDSFEPMPVKVAGTYIGVIPSVCFEDSVPRLTRHFVRPGPQVIINVTNDGWFKQSTAASQHFANARFRAIELRRPMLRCANTGVSAAVNTCGSTAHPDTGARQVLADATGSHFSRGSLLAELDVPLKPSFTLYGLIGDGGIILLALLGLGIPLLTRPRRPRTLPATSPKHPAA
ncbi:MAG: apolipoprotein N-acyltransferase [Verrucomicrobiota bacterium]